MFGLSFYFLSCYSCFFHSKVSIPDYCDLDQFRSRCFALHSRKISCLLRIDIGHTVVLTVRVGQKRSGKDNLSLSACVYNVEETIFQGIWFNCEKFNFPINPYVRQLVGWLVRQNILAGGEFTLSHRPYWRTCYNIHCVSVFQELWKFKFLILNLDRDCGWNLCKGICHRLFGNNSPNQYLYHYVLSGLQAVKQLGFLDAFCLNQRPLFLSLPCRLNQSLMLKIRRRENNFI